MEPGRLAFRFDGGDILDKTELINAISDETGYTEESIRQMVNAAVKITEEKLKAGEFVRILGFGTLDTVERAERTAIVPNIDKKIKIPATVVPRFRAGSELKAIVADSGKTKSKSKAKAKAKKKK